jgi:site-specific DNA-methyltransferase (adenine-specific)
MLPFGEGSILDPFAGSGSTLAAAEAVGYSSVGVERDPGYFALAQGAVVQLSKLYPGDGNAPPRDGEATGEF